MNEKYIIGTAQTQSTFIEYQQKSQKAWKWAF